MGVVSVEGGQLQLSVDDGDSWEEMYIAGLSMDAEPTYESDVPAALDALRTGATISFTGRWETIGCAPIPGWPGWSVLKQTWFDYWPLSAQINVTVV